MKSRTIFSRALGALEESIMNILWKRGCLSVREVSDQLAEKKLAYTTVMTTLDRLYKKGLLVREKAGQAYVYQPVLSREAYQHRIVEETVSALMQKSDENTPVLAAFVDAAAELDNGNLKKLEELIAERRRRGE